MNKHVKGALAFLLLGMAAMIGFYYLSPMLLEQKQVQTSDAAHEKGSITIGMDNFVGYFPICSPDMKKRMLASGYLLRCVDDKANYNQRMAALKSGELNFAVGTVDSLIFTGPRHGFPGTIIAVLDESKGVDAIVARDDEVGNLDDLKTKTDLKIAVTPDSPSSHFLKAVGVHFGIPTLLDRQGDWRVDADGSADALRKLLDGSVSAAVLWEPDVSRAVAQKGIKKILGTDQTSKLIVDILMVNRRFSESNPEVVEIFLSNYFRSLKLYKQNEAALIQQMSEYARIDEAQAKSILKGLRWINLHDNATQWFGVSSAGSAGAYGLFDTIEATTHILVDYGDFKSSPLPDADPRRITLSTPLIKLFNQGMAGSIDLAKSAVVEAPSDDFAPLSEAQWAALRDVGTLKVRPILFIRGSARLSLEGKEQLDKAVEALKSYPSFRIRVEGHTNPRGDAAANKELSQKRAEAVSQYLNVTYRIDPNRIQAVGLGPERPLPRASGEAQRAYFERLSRVELHLMAEVF
ncbi:MAG: phosphate ABC transporter substrate-binding/OmpA family protein [Nitrospinota bacterium]|nr:phosphate ABC transporter substrate-binding/OmpA family protein [Nitrospinota bacterium]MDH5757711.1 phosphate ABC transporter substrate-binding/OmpA family protein [Nitrospinota bacterium]